MIPVIDSHHHIWRKADLQWLQGPMLPRIFGPYEPLRRDYPIEEFRQDLDGAGVVASVYVQANWPKDRAVDETAWVQSIGDATGWPQAIVGYADMLADDAPATIDQLVKFRNFRGVRMQTHWHENELYRFASKPDVAADPCFRRNLRALAHHGLTFDLQLFTSQMAGAADMAAVNRDVTFVLQHAGMLEDLSPSGVTAWREGMKRLADQPNIVVKLSALGTFLRRNDPAHIAFVSAETVALFGPERCMFGSNFPIEKLWTTYAELIAANRGAVAHLSPQDQRQILHDTAARVYRLDAGA